MSLRVANARSPGVEANAPSGAVEEGPMSEASYRKPRRALPKARATSPRRAGASNDGNDPRRTRPPRAGASEASCRKARLERGAIALLPFVLVLACATPDAADYGDPTSLGDETTVAGITMRVVAPVTGELLEEPITTLEVSAYTEPPVPLFVEVTDALGTDYAADVAGEPGPEQRFRITLPLLHGDNAVTLRVADESALRTRRAELHLAYEGSSPGLRFGIAPVVDGECDDALIREVTAATEVCVRGRVTEAESVEVGVDSLALAATREGEFEARVTLTPDAEQELRLRVNGAGGETDLLRTVVQDATPPELTIDGEELRRTDRTRATLEGRVSDGHAIAEVRVENDAGGVVEATIDGASWSRDVQLEPGENRFEVVAVDAAGNEARQGARVIRERLIRLRPASAGGSVQLELDRAAFEELLTPAAQREIDVVTVSLRTSVEQALYAIREPERFGVDTSAWGTAEHNLANVLRMTPDTADLSGSSLEELLSIAPAVGLPAPRLVAELLDIEATDTFVDLDLVAEVVLEKLVGTHPLVVRDDDGDAAITITMYDALQELAPLASRFGPRGDHPGFLGGESRGLVFEPGFLMSIPATSNVLVREGVDARRGGKDFLYTLDDGGSAITLDFLSDDTSVVGLVDAPTASLRFVMVENDRFLRAGNRRMRNPDPERDGFFRGNGAAFDAEPWEIEHIVAETAYLQYAEAFAPGYANVLRYDAGSIVDAAVMDWDRGWVAITTSGGIGSPPPPVYAWDVLTEVAQLRLHDGGDVAEGDANLAFTIEDLPIGLDAEGLIDALLPTLQEQEAEVAARLVSEETLVESPVDVYFVATEGGEGFLFFRAPEDASGEYPYATPGFFGDESLTTPTSTTDALPGTSDTTHHKVVPVVGEVHYFADDEGGIYRLDVVEVDAEGIGIRVAPVEEGA